MPPEADEAAEEPEGCWSAWHRCQIHAAGTAGVTPLTTLLGIAVAAALSGVPRPSWLAEQLPKGDASAVAVDGKTIWGAAGAAGRRVHQLAA